METKSPTGSVKVHNANVWGHQWKFFLYIIFFDIFTYKSMRIFDSFCNQVTKFFRDPWWFGSINWPALSILACLRVPIFTKAHHFQMQLCTIPITRLVETSSSKAKVTTQLYNFNLASDMTSIRCSLKQL